jgi:hypothetical protein
MWASSFLWQSLRLSPFRQPVWIVVRMLRVPREKTQRLTLIFYIPPLQKGLIFRKYFFTQSDPNYLFNFYAHDFRDIIQYGLIRISTSRSISA